MNEVPVVVSVVVAFIASAIALVQSFRLYDKIEEVRILYRRVDSLEHRKDELIVERDKADNRFHLLVTGINAVQDTLN